MKIFPLYPENTYILDEYIQNATTMSNLVPAIVKKNLKRIVVRKKYSKRLFVRYWFAGQAFVGVLLARI
jgi:hypothetical protein